MRAIADMISSLVTHRHFVFGNAWAEMRNRYAGTILGILWHAVQPISLILLFSFVFTELMSARGAGSNNYSIYIISGILPWLAFADCLTRCTTSLTDNANFIRKVALAEFLYVARAAVVAGILMMLSLLAVMIASIILGMRPTLAWLSIPAVGLLFILFGFGLGLMLAPFHVFLRDTGQATAMVLQFWMWLSPVILLEEIMPAGLRYAQNFNPAAYFIRALRDPLVNGTVTGMHNWLIMIMLVFGSVWIGQRLMQLTRSDIRDAL